MTKSSSFAHFIKTINPPDFIGELHLNGCDYWIISLGNGKDESRMDGALIGESNSYVEMGRFEIDGQACAILRTAPSSAEVMEDFTAILTERELQIATLVAMGRLNKQIADKLHISEWTVSTHLRRIFAKLGVRSRAAMVYRCAALIGMARF